METLAQDIRNTLNALVADAHQRLTNAGAGAWTLAVKEALGALGEAKGYRICTAGLPQYEAEWLYDMVWYEERGFGNQRRLVSVPLVVESEWNPNFNQIKYDFEKLLVANADLRLMICYVCEEKVEAMMAYFKEAVQCYQQGRPGDSFLIAMLNCDGDRFVYHTIKKR